VEIMATKKIAVLGAGGLGLSAVKMLENKREFLLVALCDKKGYAFSLKGIPSGLLDRLLPEESVADLPKIGFRDNDPIGAIISKMSKIDGIFIALPNIPNSLVPTVVKRFIRAGYNGVMVDVLKRANVVDQILKMKSLIKKSGIVYITCAGETPGILTSAAAVASQSFVEVKKVEIKFGVGISNWEQYRSTIMENIAYLEGFNIDKVSKFSDEDIEELLKTRKGILNLKDIEHADDIILEYAEILDKSKVSVSGVVDTKNPKAPISTTVHVTGITFEGKTATNTFTLSDDTTMADNVCGPAFGFMKAGFWLKDFGISGLFTSAEILPHFVR
jgi:hypothetical protein